MPFLYIAGFLCAAPNVLNYTMFTNTPYDWNAFDQKTLERAQRRCVELYPNTSPCLKNFYKIGERDYKAICGAKLK